MTNEIRIFDNPEFGKVRVIMIDGEPWFIAKDVAEVLGYKDPDQAIRKNCKHARDFAPVQTTGANFSSKARKFKIIPESDVYRLIIKSKLPAAEKFETWVMEELIPSVRKHGAYLTPETVEKAVLNPDFLIGLLEKFKEVKEELTQTKKQLTDLKPKAEFGERILKAETNIKVGDFAKYISDHRHYVIGRNRLFKILRNEDILQKNNVPYQIYIDRGYFEVQEQPIEIGNTHVINRTTLITPKGQEWLVKLIDSIFENSN